MKTKYFLTGFMFLALWLGISSNLFSTNIAIGDYDSPIESLLAIPGDLSSSTTGAIVLEEDKCIDHKWKYTELWCKEIGGKHIYCFKLKVFNVEECGKVKVSIGEPNVLSGSPAWSWDVDGNLLVQGCFLASTAVNPLCVKINFDNPLCCDIEACTKLPDCCKEQKWAGEVKCKVINGQQAYCFKIKAYQVKDCDLEDFTIGGTPVPGTFNKYYLLDGTLVLEGCVWASSVTTKKLCFTIDFKNPKCCDISGCLSLPPPCCIDHEWKGSVKCDVINGQPVYCYNIKIFDVKDCKTPTISVEGTDVSGPTLLYDISGNLYISGCVLQSTVTPDSLCFKVNFPNDGCCDFKGCIKLPKCCEDRKWDYNVECKVIKGIEVYCYDLTIFDSEACKLIEFNTGGTTITGPNITYSGGNINISGCVTRSSVGSNLCFKANFKNPKCCYLADCMELPKCCEDHKWKGLVTCKIIDNRPAYCYHIEIADVEDCGKFKIGAGGTPIPGTLTHYYNADGNLVVDECYWVSSYPADADSMCFEIDFENQECCDFGGCMPLPVPCCVKNPWKGSVKCDVINGIPVYCYSIYIVDAAHCGKPKVFMGGTHLSGPDCVYDVAGNLIISGCIKRSSLPAGASSLCFGIDFPGIECCDFKGCMTIPKECCVEKSYDMEQLFCYIKDGKKIYCYRFLVKDAKECGEFKLTTNGVTVDGPSYEYGPSGEVYIKHCVTSIEGKELCIKIDWISDLCCDIKDCYKLPTLCLSDALKGNDHSSGISIEGQLEMSVLPVPANEFVNIKVINLEQTAYISVMDINNKQVLKTDLIDQNTTLNTSNLVGGIYFIHLISVDGQRLATKQVSIVH